jgi:hypothetical protein
MDDPRTGITEAESVDYVKSLYEMEADPETPRAVINLGPFSAFVMICALQLAMRHPEFSPTQADLLAQIIDQMRPLFSGTIGWELLELGNHPEFDIPCTCAYPFGPHAPECPPDGHAGFAPEHT